MTEEHLRAWQRTWREGFVPLLSLANLQVLREALATDDQRLLQGATGMPPPLACVSEWPVEGACPLGYMGAMEYGGFAVSPFDEGQKFIRRLEAKDAATVAEVESYFAEICHEADQLLGEPAGCRFWLNYIDDTPRDVMRREMLAEVERAIARKEASDAG